MMQLLADSWFQRALTVLVLVQLVLLAVLMTLRSLPPAERVEATSGPGLTHQAATAPQVQPKPTPPARTCKRNFVINDNIGKVGHVRLGMGLAKAEKLLCEKLIPIQQPGHGSKDFRYAAPKAGLELRGTRKTIDTVVVTNVGKGTRYRTTRGVKISDAEQAVGRAYTYAYLVCGTEWWVERGDLTLKFNFEPRISSITLTNRKRSPYVECP